MEVVIDRLDDFGRGIAYIDDKVCFVENALVGEKVDIKVISEHSKFLEAKVVKYIKKSKDRVEVKCPYYDICGGCNLSHLKYKEENKFKLEKVKNIFKKFSNIDIDINKYTGISDVLIYNGKLISNDSSIISNIGEKKYYLSTNSFFQVNQLLVDDLYKEVKDNIIGDKILDLYCGTGSIGIYVGGNNITGIDNNTSNIHDANRNLELNNISGEFYLADVEDIIDRFDNFDTVIVDPPRSGLDKETISNLMRINSKRIIYVSCEPITLVRDLALMIDKYEVSKVKVFNMFPRTYHVETISVLCRKTIEK